MKIETKFNEGQQVWVIIQSKARHLPITKIDITVDEGIANIQYYLNKGTKENYSPCIINEEFIFKTRDDLIKNLLTNDDGIV